MPWPVKLPTKEVAESHQKPMPSSEAKNRIVRYVTIFGDSAIEPSHPVYQSVYELARHLAKEGYGIVDGGGPGVMEAAIKGAEAEGGYTFAVYWEPKLASHFEGRKLTNITSESESYSNYLMRTLGLIEHGQVFIVCQGGTGTVSEFGMVWALAKMYFGRHKPVILFGEFWHKVVDAFIDNMLIDDEEKGALYFAHTQGEVIDLLAQFEVEIQARKQEILQGDELAFVIDSRAQVTQQSYSKVAKIYHEERAGKLVSQKQLDEFISLVSPGKALDIGAGPGYDLGYLAQKYDMVGIELSPQFAAIARFENPKSEIRCENIVHSKLGDEVYQGIWSRDALHHIPVKSQDAVFKKISDALVHSGIFYLIVQEGEGETVKEEIRSGYQIKRFYHYFTEQEIRERAKKAGLEVIKVEKITRSHVWLSVVLRKP